MEFHFRPLTVLSAPLPLCLNNPETFNIYSYQSALFSTLHIRRKPLTCGFFLLETLSQRQCNY